MNLRRIAGTLVLVAALTGGMSKAIADNSSDTLPPPAASGEAAPDAGPRHHAHHGHFMERVQRVQSLSSLTPDQKQQIDQIVQSFKSDMQGFRQQVQEMKRSASAAKAGGEQGGDVTSTPATAAKGGGAVALSQDQRSALREQIKQKTQEAMKKVLAVLTPEQKEQLKKEREAAGASKGERAPRLNAKDQG